MKNRNIKAYDVNLISMERSFIFCFKTTYVSISSCFVSIVCCLFFFMFLHPLEKELPVNPLHPSEISGFNPPSPLEFPVTFRGGGGGGYGYFLEPHILLDKEDITLSNNNKQKRLLLLNFPCTAIMAQCIARLLPSSRAADCLVVSEGTL